MLLYAPVREVRAAPAAQPQADRYVHEGVPLSLFTLADQVGAAAAALQPPQELLEGHVLAAERLHDRDRQAQ
jgi:transposase